MKKWIFLSIGIITLVIVLVISYINYKNSHYLDDETIRDIFGTDVEYRLVKAYDLTGLEIHDNKCTFYEYYVDSSSIKRLMVGNALLSFPSFERGIFKNKNFNNDVKIPPSIKWKKTPITSYTDTMLYDATFGYHLNNKTMLAFSESKKLNECIRFSKTDYIHQQGNYYTYISSTYFGHLFFILVPKENRLYLFINS